MLKIKPTVIEKISTLTTFGSIFPINLAHVIFFISCWFTKAETKKIFIVSGYLLEWVNVLFFIQFPIPNYCKYPVYQFIFYVI